MAGAASSGSRGAIAQSDALRGAALRSEVRRAWVVIGVVALVALLVLARSAAIELDYRLRLAGILGVGVLFALQLGVLAVARWASARRRAIPTWFVAATVVVEALIPTGMLVFQLVFPALPPYTTLSGPPVMSYPLMILLTTLRLRPWLCVLSGAIAGGGYAGLYVYVAYGMAAPPPTEGLPQAAYVNSAALIFISGLVGAWVAREIRGHMEAALGEAETRRQMARIEQDLAAARSIQLALLPRQAPEIPGFEIAGWNRPADQTGGDYYDWQEMADGTWIVTLADVSGHGIGPAMVTAACRAYVRASSAHHSDLGSLTTRINQLLADDLPEGRFITMVGVLIGADGGAPSLLSAGHGPIVLYVGKSGVVEDILAHDMPLAILAESRFGPARPVAMASGDVLALVTDGFVEWARYEGGKREEFGLARLRESLHRHAGLPAAEMIEAITADVAAFAGGEKQQDDLTMVVVKKK